MNKLLFFLGFVGLTLAVQYIQLDILTEEECQFSLRTSALDPCHREICSQDSQCIWRESCYGSDFCFFKKDLNDSTRFFLN